MHDLVVRNGQLVDGTGGPPRWADVASDGDRIGAVGDDLGAAHRVIDADGRLVAPGRVDVHTHYDAQVSWDPLLTPSSWHGVTTVVMGNCGVGFAPAAPDRREWLPGTTAAADARMAFDFRAGACRLVQRASGYAATVCSGLVTVEEDEFTGALPGKLVRGPRTL